MKTVKKIILHLCADTGSDTKPYQDDPDYEVILVGAAIGVENYHPPKNVYGIIANPVCTEFSTARANGKARNPDQGMFLVEQCMRIIEEASPVFWVIENPARGVLSKYLGDPKYKYEPWWYGSAWTKQTALWGKFNVPQRAYDKWEDVPKLDGLYQRPGRGKPSLAFMHKSHYHKIPEFQTLPAPDSDMEFRSLCSQKFAKAFKSVNL
jgi:site-specific DNA-cytosine methylase